MLEIVVQSWLLLTGICLTLLVLVIGAQSVRAVARRAKARLREDITVTMAGGSKRQLYPAGDRH